MPLHITSGKVVSLEVRPADRPDAPNAVITLYPSKHDGFHGELALARLTRPAIAIAYPEPSKQAAAARVQKTAADRRMAAKQEAHLLARLNQLKIERMTLDTPSIDIQSIFPNAPDFAPDDVEPTRNPESSAPPP